MEPLFNKRKNASNLFVFDILSGRINSSKILSLLDFNDPPRTLRNSVFLRTKVSRTNYSTFEPVKTMSALFNDYLFEFGMSRYMLISVASHCRI